MRAAISRTTTERSTSPWCILLEGLPRRRRGRSSRMTKRVQRQPALQVQVDQHREVAAEGRQSPYQDDFSAPPRPKTSSSGSSSVISGVGHADQDDGAGEVAGVEGLLVGLGAADRLDHHVGAEAAGELADRLDRVGRRGS